MNLNFKPLERHTFPLKSAVILMVLTLPICPTANGDQIYVPEYCDMGYTGVVYKPCGFCHICVKRLTYLGNVISKCDTNRGMKVFEAVYRPPKDVSCEPIKSYCKSENARKSNGQIVGFQIYGTYKCACDETRYGPACNGIIPLRLTFRSYADVKNVVFDPYVYADNYATIYVYLFATGEGLSVQVESDTQLLTYDETSCRKSTRSTLELCDDILSKSGVPNYAKICGGSPTYERQVTNNICVVAVNISFYRVQIKNLKDRDFFVNFDNNNVELYRKTVVAKKEHFSVRVINTPHDGDRSVVVFSRDYEFLVLYSGQSMDANCPLIVDIPLFSKRSQRPSIFTRTQSISISSRVKVADGPDCLDIGEPTLDWDIWILKVNHDEQTDTPVYRRLETNSSLEIKPYTLSYGVFKVKNKIRLSSEKYYVGTTYCYFKIVKVPLQPYIVGGSARHVYYKNNIMLRAGKRSNPNYAIDQQPQLLLTWSCNDTSFDFCDTLVTTEPSIVVFGPFEKNKAFKFTLEMIDSLSNSSEIAEQTVTVAPDHIPSLMLHCLENCGGKGFKSNIREIFYFKVNGSNYLSERDDLSEYKWTCTTNDSVNIDVNEIRQKNTPQWIFIVKKNTLQTDRTYSFKVVGGGSPSGQAEILVETFKLSDSLNCDISPQQGIAGETKFHVNCSEPRFDELLASVKFYFYDIGDNGNKRLLCSSYGESVDDIILSRGTIMVQAMDSYGHTIETELKVTLTQPIVTDTFLEENLKLINEMSDSVGYQQKLSYISSVCDILRKSNHTISENYTDNLLNIIFKEKSATTIVKTELILSALESVLCYDKENDNECLKKDISIQSYRYLSETLRSVTNKMLLELQTSEIDSGLSTTEGINLYTSLLKSSSVLLFDEEQSLTNKNYDFDLKTYTLYKRSNLRTMKTLERINTALGLRNKPFTEPLVFDTKYIKVWVKEDFPSNFADANETIGYPNGSYIVVSPHLAKTIKKNTEIMMVQLIEYEENQFQWTKSEDISTSVLSLKFGNISDNYSKNSPIDSFHSYVDIYLKKTNDSREVVSGYVLQPNASTSLDLKDLAVAVHRLFPKIGSEINIKFLGMNETEPLRVLVTINFRPDYDAVKSGVRISKDFSWYFSNKKAKRHEDIVFIGILLDSDIQSQKAVHYEFELQSVRCQVWYDVAWETFGCRLGPQISDDFVHCQCDHLSYIGAYIGVPINMIDPFSDYKLFLTIPDNPLVFSFISLLLLLFMVLLIWLVKKDKRDVGKNTLIVLEDNISGDTFGYIVTIFTGSKFCAGTTSLIGIILHGSLYSSRAHILWSRKRRTLKRGSDDWFLLYCPQHLGELLAIQLWTNHDGEAPNWLCDRVHIHDLFTKKNYLFILGKWFGVDQVGVRVTSFAKPVELDTEEHFLHFFFINTVNGFRESHGYLSILFRHPRSSTSRAQRLAIAMVALLGMLLADIMFFEAEMPKGVDIPEFFIGKKELLISFYSMIIGITLAAIVTIPFYLSHSTVKVKITEDKPSIGRKKYTFEKQKSKETINPSLTLDSARSLKVSRKEKRTLGYYLKKTILCLRKRNFHPVLAEQDVKRAKIIVVHRFRAIIAWFVCLVVTSATSLLIVWIGLKIGKVKSQLWLTSTFMGLSQDVLVVDPVKILIISLLFSVKQTQYCDLYGYDPKVYEFKQIIKQNKRIKHDSLVHKIRLHQYYKKVPVPKFEAMKAKHTMIQRWRIFIDIFDVVFSVIVVSLVVSNHLSNRFIWTNEVLKQCLFKNINSNRNFIPTETIQSTGQYIGYIQDVIFTGIFQTQWYNEKLLTVESELYPETGWFITLPHRLIGVARLRQIRVERNKCEIPSIMKTVSYYCNVKYSLSTEETLDYGPHWKAFHESGIVFKKSPWDYHFPLKNLSLGMYTESRNLFHGGGFIAELKRTKRQAADQIFFLLDAGWLDIRTRVAFFELTAYNVNDRVFTSIVFMIEHLASTLVLTGERVWSVSIILNSRFFDTLYILYSFLALVKLVAFKNTSGKRFSINNFWIFYDALFIIIGICYIVGYSIFLRLASSYVKKFQVEQADSFFEFQTHLLFDTVFLGLLQSLAALRLLRLLKYATRTITVKQMNTLYFTWPKVQWIVLVLMLFLFLLEQPVAYLVNKMFPTSISHLMMYKLDFNSLNNNAVCPGKTMFLYIPCFIATLAMVFSIVVVIRSYAAAQMIYYRENFEEDEKHSCTNELF